MGIAPGGSTEHVCIVVKVLISQCLSLRTGNSNHRKVILNQIEDLCQIILGQIKMCSVSSEQSETYVQDRVKLNMPNT